MMVLETPMKSWEVRTLHPDENQIETFYVIAVSAAHAREWAKRRGLKVERVSELLPDEAPPDAEFHTFTLHPEDVLQTIAQSPLIRSPVWTIALGILVGMLLSACVISIISSAMGGNVRVVR